jgi:hypothetical protein
MSGRWQVDLCIGSWGQDEVLRVVVLLAAGWVRELAGMAGGALVIRRWQWWLRSPPCCSMAWWTTGQHISPPWWTTGQHISPPCHMPQPPAPHLQLPCSSSPSCPFNPLPTPCVLPQPAAPHLQLRAVLLQRRHLALQGGHLPAGAPRLEGQLRQAQVAEGPAGGGIS